MECTSRKIINVTFTQDEAEDLKQEILTLLSNYDRAMDLRVLNTLNNLVNIELTRLANE